MKHRTNRICRFQMTKQKIYFQPDGLMLLFLLFATFILPNSSSGFGFDSANSCTPSGKMSRRGRAQMLAAIPCDLERQPFCHLPGSAYPWHAVRRFVHENQGLMKRMYGDVRHISILRDEIHKNEVDVDDMEDTAERYSKDGGAQERSGKYLMHGREKDRDRERDDFVNYKGNDVLMEPHFRPVSTTSTTTTTTTTKDALTTSPPISNSTVKSLINASSPRILPNFSTNSTPSPLPTVGDPETNSVYEKPSSSKITLPKSDGDNIQIIESPQLGLRNLSLAIKMETTKLSSTTPTPDNVQFRPSEPTIKTNSSSTTSSKIPLVVRRNITKSTPAVTTPMSFASFLSTSSTSVSLGQRKPWTTSTPPPITSITSTTTTKPSLLREGQLFQDAMKQEPVSISSNMRGVNACPVKDEVVAPFWANNTRGEVLALLNLYPFEQYVHWEKCTHEFKQMFCRDGCRCEQQYRLHRLLAYDPHNECRGIFSDWFRFPSSCICKCYNIPMEFRATSRSPRSESSFVPNPIDSAEAEVQRAIYEHATDQWYRPRDELDNFEG